jgi:hypothetical protein
MGNGSNEEVAEVSRVDLRTEQEHVNKIVNGDEDTRQLQIL